ncbi:ubiquinol-cytochrome C chaperone family protein [Maricaulis maris]|uniref:Cytochrome b pre-mRNA-processing protein 3 n=1 Tax=Maricaulis maris TaxID=74318 RepID=A0A495DMB3_9PROT|nr:ubiquinol-cytochrome C chaperone family protein [Maricaulis maris]RKR02876.1 cytochrome b pre-mRNA-processing protein 3 [Maricaulis maris]
MLNRLFSRKPEKRRAEALYRDVVTAARAPHLYAGLGVPDTVEGRFEMIILHCAVVVLTLKPVDSDPARGLSQALFDTMFDDFDAAMREMGVGDSGVGKKIRFMAQGFYGRAEALRDAIDSPDPGQLQAVLARNVFNAGPDDPRAPALALYVNSAVEALNGQGGQALLDGAAPDFPQS